MKDVLDTLKKDVEIPDVVNKKADEAFRKIYAECESGENKKTENIQPKRYHTKRITVLAAAVVALCAVTAAAAVVRWSHSLSDGLQASEKQMKQLESNGMNTFVEQPCTVNGVTVTAVQSITDNYYTHIAFKVEGFDLEEGKEPSFENINVTVDGEEEFGYSAGFWEGIVDDNEGNPVTLDGERLKTDENGRLIINYVMDDGSLEYEMILTNDVKEAGYFIGKNIHVELENLGIYTGKLDHTTKVEGTWTFDWTLGGADTTRVCEMDYALGDTGATVKRLEISPISVIAEYDFPRQTVVEDRIEADGTLGTLERYAEPPSVVGVELKDGTVIKYLYGGPGSGGYEGETGNTYRSKEAANRIIDPDEIESILFIKNYTQWKDIETPEFIEVPLNK